MLHRESTYDLVLRSAALWLSVAGANAPTCAFQRDHGSRSRTGTNSQLCVGHVAHKPGGMRILSCYSKEKSNFAGCYTVIRHRSYSRVCGRACQKARRTKVKGVFVPQSASNPTHKMYFNHTTTFQALPANAKAELRDSESANLKPLVRLPSAIYPKLATATERLAASSFRWRLILSNSWRVTAVR